MTIEAFLALGDALYGLKHRLFLATLPDGHQPLNKRTADPNLRPLRLSPLEIAELRETIRQTKIQIVKAWKQLQVAQRGTYDPWLDQELTEARR